MKRALAVLIAVPLLVTGCSQHKASEAYSNVDELIADIEESGLDWSCTVLEEARIGDTAAECEADGETVPVSVFTDDDSRADMIAEIRENESWHAGTPAVGLGATWQAYCPSEEPCRDLIKKLGGSVVTAPDYSINGS